MKYLRGKLKLELQPLCSFALTSGVSKISEKIAALIERHRGPELSPYYLGYFELSNARLFFEAHDVLEELWLPNPPKNHQGDFHKGLIQLAGAFVHLQRHGFGLLRRFSIGANESGEISGAA